MKSLNEITQALNEGKEFWVVKVNSDDEIYPLKKFKNKEAMKKEVYDKWDEPKGKYEDIYNDGYTITHYSDDDLVKKADNDEDIIFGEEID
jgi:regulator of replication initiation timing